MKSPTKSDLEKLRHHSQIYFAVFCAEQVFHLIKQKHQLACRQAIDIVKLFIEGKATKEECRAATYVVYDAAARADAYAVYAAYVAATTVAAYAIDAAYAAANAAAHAATYAAAAAKKDKQAIIKAQWVYYKDLLAFETIVEDVLLA